jgi:hypothetical protein
MILGSARSKGLEFGLLMKSSYRSLNGMVSLLIIISGANGSSKLEPPPKLASEAEKNPSTNKKLSSKFTFFINFFMGDFGLFQIAAHVQLKWKERKKLKM